MVHYVQDLIGPSRILNEGGWKWNLPVSSTLPNVSGGSYLSAEFGDQMVVLRNLLNLQWIWSGGFTAITPSLGRRIYLDFALCGPAGTPYQVDVIWSRTSVRQNMPALYSPWTFDCQPFFTSGAMTGTQSFSSQTSSGPPQLFGGYSYSYLFSPSVQGGVLGLYINPTGPMVMSGVDTEQIAIAFSTSGAPNLHEWPNEASGNCFNHAIDRHTPSWAQVPFQPIIPLNYRTVQSTHQDIVGMGVFSSPLIPETAPGWPCNTCPPGNHLVAVTVERLWSILAHRASGSDWPFEGDFHFIRLNQRSACSACPLLWSQKHGSDPATTLDDGQRIMDNSNPPHVAFASIGGRGPYEFVGYYCVPSPPAPLPPIPSPAQQPIAPGTFRLFTHLASGGSHTGVDLPVALLQGLWPSGTTNPHPPRRIPQSSTFSGYYFAFGNNPPTGFPNWARVYSGVVEMGVSPSNPTMKMSHITYTLDDNGLWGILETIFNRAQYEGSISYSSGGCAGALGAKPELAFASVPVLGGSIRSTTNSLSPSRTGAVAFGLASTATSFGANCESNIAQLLHVAVGADPLITELPVPQSVALAGLVVFAQAFGFDGMGGIPGGFSAGDLVTLTVGR